jgi:hypothetical protein
MGGIMVKKKLTHVVLLCYLLIGLNACGYVLAGAVDLKRDYEAPVARMWEATLQAVEELKLATESKRHDAFGGEIKGIMANGDSFQIEVKRLGENWTEVGVRIGTFGDRTKFTFQRTCGASAPLFYCGIHVGRGKLIPGSPPLQEVRYHPSPHWLAQKSVGAFFSLASGLH